VLRVRTTADWMARLEAESVPCAPALTRNQVIEHPQTVAGGTLVETDHPTAGRLRQTRVAARFESMTPNEPRGAPRLGEHTEQVLAEIGVEAGEIARLKAAGVIGATEAAETAVA
jgi:crotonobetainyl-CoA:carnitine CoA-transferase CaiB-like acyl-CoA transferase